jgi:hydrogenase maturation protease
MARLYVFGLGSPYGWDILGWRVAESLQVQLAGQRGIRIDTLAQPADLFIYNFQPTDHLVLLDAVVGGGTLGEIHELTPEELALRQVPFRAPTSSHGINLKTVLELLVNTGFPAERIGIFGITVPEQTESDDVSMAMWMVTEQVAKELLPRITHRQMPI